MREVSRYKRGMVFWIEDRTEDKNNTYVKYNNREIKSSVMAGTRPWLIISCDVSNENSSIVNIVPITSSKNQNENVPYHVQFFYQGEHQTILVEQIKTIDGFCIGRYMYTLSDEVMSKVEDVMRTQFKIREKISCTEETLKEVIQLIQPSIQKIIYEKANIINKFYTERNIEDIAIKIGQDLEDLFALNGNQVHNEVNENLEQITEDIECNSDNKINVNIVEDNSIVQSNNIEKVNLEESKEINSIIENNRMEIQQVEENLKIGSVSANKKNNASIKSDIYYKWTLESKKKFLEDCKNMKADEVMKLWSISSKGSLYSTKYSFKKEIEMIENRLKKI